MNDDYHEQADGRPGRSGPRSTSTRHPSEVWAALTQAEELVRWFPTDAKVTPGKAGPCSGPGATARTG